jgi:hypothetical protein
VQVGAAAVRRWELGLAVGAGSPVRAGVGADRDSRGASVGRAAVRTGGRLSAWRKTPGAAFSS